MPRRAVVVALSVAVAVVVNLVLYALGRLAGGSYEFTSAGQPSEVNAVTVAGFSAVPLLLGLTAVALLARFGWVRRAALIAGPVLAAGTILLMTIPADFDTVSTIALGLCHLALIPILVVAVRDLTGVPAPAATAESRDTDGVSP